MGGKSALLLLECGAHDIRRVGPHQSWADAFGADARGIKQVANLTIKLARLVVNRLDERMRSGIVPDRGHLLEHAATAEDRGERRAQFVGYAADESVA